MAKLDYLKECNNHGVPLEDFKQQFCDRCHQPECTRSQHGGSRFEKRVTTWEDTLFKNPARMDKGDPRYSQIAAKKFLTIPGPSRRVAPQKAAWVDPRELDKPEVQPQISDPTPVPEPVKVEQSISKPVVPVVEATQIPEASEPKPELKQAPGVAIPLMNTPFVGAQMLGGREKKEPPEKKDPWTLNPGVSGGKDIVVKPGAKIRLGS